MSRSQTSLVAVVILVLTGLTITISISALDCIPSEDFSWALQNREPENDGKIHVTFSFNDPNISQQSKDAILNAIAQWNSQSNTTGVFIEPAGQGQSGDLEFKNSTNPDETGLCAGYKPATQRIYYNPQWEQRAANSQSGGATVMAHELGHFLGLSEGGVNPSQPSIMNNPTFVPGVTTCQNATVTTPTVQASDAVQSGNCIASVRPSPTSTPTPECTIEECEAGCAYSCSLGGCAGSGCDSPIILDLAANGLDLTDPEHGARFDIDLDEIEEQLSWTSAHSDDVFLVLDRNGNGLIDNGSELFGNYSPQCRPPFGEKRNGFLALAEYDKVENGGNQDGRLDDLDGIITFLRLWKDVNQNGLSEQGELFSFEHLGLQSIDLDYKESRRVDQFGNRFRYRAKINAMKGTKTGQMGMGCVSNESAIESLLLNNEICTLSGARSGDCVGNLYSQIITAWRQGLQCEIGAVRNSLRIG